MAFQAPVQTGNQSPSGTKSGNQRSGPPQRFGAGLVQLNIERLPPLLTKWQKSLGKDLKKIEIVYDVDGVNVYLYGMDGTPFHKDAGDSISIPEYKGLKAGAQAPDDQERLRAFRDKFELRLNMAFPKEGPTSGKEEDIRAFLEKLEFRQRRAMLMSNKQFKAAYPNGFTQA